jgi:hypothetical protein
MLQMVCVCVITGPKNSYVITYFLPLKIVFLLYDDQYIFQITDGINYH